MLTTSELQAMQTTAAASMLDICVIQTLTVVTNAIGEDTYTPVDGQVYTCAVTCAVQWVTNQEARRPDGVMSQVEAQIRLPVNATVATTQRIKVTHRYGVQLGAPWVFEVLGEPELGPTAVVVKGRRV